jgi:hypothetical protein
MGGGNPPDPETVALIRRLEEALLMPEVRKSAAQIAAQTRRWREMDSNHRSLAGSPSLSDAQIDVAARHYEGDALEHRHVVKRARIHSDHIGRFA